MESKLDVSYRLGRKGGTLRGLWDYEAIDREFYEVLPGEKQTTTNMLGVSYRVRPMKGLRFDAGLQARRDRQRLHARSTASARPSCRPGYPNPWNPETPQYTGLPGGPNRRDDSGAVELGQGSSSALAWVGGASTLSGQLRLVGRQQQRR